MFFVIYCGEREELLKERGKKEEEDFLLSHSSFKVLKEETNFFFDLYIFGRYVPFKIFNGFFN